MNNNLPLIEITALPKHSYFEWFLLGFYELEKQGKIRFRIRVDWTRTVAKYTSTRLINGPIKRIFRQSDRYNCEGWLYYQGKKIKFCIDCSDAPTSFDYTLLKEVVCYFKMQCPKTLTEDGFEIGPGMKAPWIDVPHETDFCRHLVEITDVAMLQQKVRPLMVGPRMLSWGISYRALHRSYQNYAQNIANVASQKMMCYFGNALGTTPFKIDDISYCDFTELSHFAPNFTTPNEKRKIAFDLMREMGEDYDARLISDGKPGDPPTHPEMFIPRDEFCKHISKFEYNLNISGKLMSIPNRFIESFMVGTAIVTDKLALKWYKPFGCEVVETVPMGYLPMDEVDWEQFKKDIANLPPVNKKDILHEFDTKWRPDVVAQYMIDEILAAREAQQ